MRALTVLYEDILRSLSVLSNEQGLLTIQTADNSRPCTVGNKRMVLPTPEVLKCADWNSMTAFHPLSENLLRGESPVIEKLKFLIGYRIEIMVGLLATRLLEVAADTQNHKNLTPKQAQFLTLAPDVDTKTVLDWIKVYLAFNHSDKKFINIYLKRSGTYGGRSHQRVSVVTFPVTEELARPDPTIYGIVLRKKDKEAISGLLNWILPGADNWETYSHGSSSMVAPYFDALINTFLKMATQINAVTELFANVLEDYAHIHADLEWAEDVLDMSAYKGLIPALEGNEGEREQLPTAPPPPPTTTAPTAAPAPAIAPAPQTTLPVKPVATTQPPPISSITQPLPQQRFGQPQVDTYNRLPGVQGNQAPMDSQMEWESIVAQKQMQQYQTPVFPTVGYNSAPPIHPNQPPVYYGNAGAPMGAGYQYPNLPGYPPPVVQPIMPVFPTVK